MPLNIMRHEEEHLYAPAPASAAGQALSRALLRLRRAQRVQERRVRTVSGLSELDLLALRYLVQAERDGREVSPKDLRVMLSTSPANVTNVIDRLVARGFITRKPQPRDRRAPLLGPPEAAADQVDTRIGFHHQRMVEAINALSDGDAAGAAEVIDAIAAALDELALQQNERVDISPAAAGSL